MLLLIDFSFFKSPWLATIIISMLPIFELKGSIPVGMSKTLWNEYALNFYEAFLCAMIGTIIITPILILIITPILNYLKRTKFLKGLAQKVENKIKENSLKNSRSTLIKQYFALFLFVAIPLPLTGVYMGCAIASFLKLNFWLSCLCVIIGNFVSGVVITILSYFCGDFSLLIVLTFTILLVLILIYNHYKKKKLNNQNSDI